MLIKRIFLYTVLAVLVLSPGQGGTERPLLGDDHSPESTPFPPTLLATGDQEFPVIAPVINIRTHLQRVQEFYQNHEGTFFAAAVFITSYVIKIAVESVLQYLSGALESDTVYQSSF